VTGPITAYRRVKAAAFYLYDGTNAQAIVDWSHGHCYIAEGQLYRRDLRVGRRLPSTRRSHPTLCLGRPLGRRLRPGDTDMTVLDAIAIAAFGVLLVVAMWAVTVLTMQIPN